MKKIFIAMFFAIIVFGYGNNVFADCSCVGRQQQACECRERCKTRRVCVSEKPASSAFQQYSDWIHCWPCTPKACRTAQLQSSDK